MKKTICFLLFIFAFAAYPQASDFASMSPYKMQPKLAHRKARTDDFIYGSAQLMGGLPMAGVGVRLQNETHSLDFSGYTCFVDFPHAVSIFHLRGLCLFYPKQKGFYVGAGFGLLNEPETTGISGSIESAIGVQWKEQFFLELNAVAPFFTSIFPVWPGLTLGIGF